ncbi:4000_t:CDS:2 [Entrophospora sp. SA101]|nr:4000_t:CDS:2 [Entrophospora sp. SA101]
MNSRSNDGDEYLLIIKKNFKIEEPQEIPSPQLSKPPITSSNYSSIVWLDEAIYSSHKNLQKIGSGGPEKFIKQYLIISGLLP